MDDDLLTGSRKPLLWRAGKTGRTPLAAIASCFIFSFVLSLLLIIALAQSHLLPTKVK